MTREEAIQVLRDWDGYFIGHSSDDVNGALNMAIEALSSSEKPNTCGDAISRQAAIDAMYELCDTGETLKENPWRDNPHIDAITDAIDDLPSVTPQQRTGRWIEKEEEGEAEPFIIWECSECNEAQKRRTKFCPNCGEKMEVQEC